MIPLRARSSRSSSPPSASSPARCPYGHSIVPAAGAQRHIGALAAVSTSSSFELGTRQNVRRYYLCGAIVLTVQRRLNIYIFDYFTKHGFQKAAAELCLEAELDPSGRKPPIDAPQGLLYEFVPRFDSRSIL